jgi:hypothetical protein
VAVPPGPPAIARDQDHSAEVAVDQHSGGGDLSPVIDGFAVGDRQVGASGHEPLQVDHAAASLRDIPVFIELPSQSPDVPTPWPREFVK